MLGPELADPAEFLLPLSTSETPAQHFDTSLDSRQSGLMADSKEHGNEPIPVHFAAIIDPDSLPEVQAFVSRFGSTVTHVVPRAAPDPMMPRNATTSWREWPGAAEETEQPEKTINPETGIWPISQWGSECGRWPMSAGRNRTQPKNVCRKEWLAEQRLAAHRWARWYRWCEENQQVADEWRRRHQDESGSDRIWLINWRIGIGK
jgi:hypothetical protein